MEELNTGRAFEEDLRKVETESLKKSVRHRLDEYIAIILGVGAVLLLWFLQEIGLY
jgi:HD superfamily phosphohydrolase YqeK